MTENQTIHPAQTHRLYAFSHSWLSGVQKGIQMAHAVADLGQQWSNHVLFKEWVTKGKTIILLEGGPSKSLEEMYNLLSEQTKLPYADFREDEDSLEGSRTSVVVVIPETMYSFDFLDEEDVNETKDRFLLNNPKVKAQEIDTLLEILRRTKRSRLAV